MSQTIKSKWQKLFSLVYRLTLSESVLWDETTDSDIYITSINDYSIEMERYDAANYTMRVRGSDGKIVDEFSDEQISGASNPFANRDFKEMYDKIRRVHSGADRILDEVITSLETKDDEFPF